MNLVEKKCIPCEGGIPKLTLKEAQFLQTQIPGWTIQGDLIQRSFRFKNFIQAMHFVNSMAQLAEEQGHHPDFCVHYNQVEVTLWTHAIEGLSENDFILAAKIDQIEKN
ncbi:MAG: 4a-hydroxytetrahydrobiopterin dehydratase [Deltaproteobacteria bacterium]|nr:4a-hydroxytetrahydrobiopterin dehydratase [Deltaproteobacteria bacterium]